MSRTCGGPGGFLADTILWINHNFMDYQVDARISATIRCDFSSSDLKEPTHTSDRTERKFVNAVLKPSLSLLSINRPFVHVRQ